MFVLRLQKLRLSNGHLLFPQKRTHLKLRKTFGKFLSSRKLWSFWTSWFIKSPLNTCHNFLYGKESNFFFKIVNRFTTPKYTILQNVPSKTHYLSIYKGKNLNFHFYLIFFLWWFNFHKSIYLFYLKPKSGLECHKLVTWCGGVVSIRPYWEIFKERQWEGDRIYVHVYVGLSYVVVKLINDSNEILVRRELWLIKDKSNNDNFFL